MFEHDRFEELASLAAIGELSPAEFEEFERHKQSCRECRYIFAGTRSVASAAFLASSQADEKDGTTERHERLRANIARRLSPVVPVAFVERRQRLVAAVVAGAFVLGTGAGAGIGYRTWARGMVQRPVALIRSVEPNTLIPTPSSLEQDQGGRLRTALAEMQKQIEETRREDGVIRDKLAESGQRADAMQARLGEVENQSAAQAQELLQARNDLAGTQGELSRAKDALSASEAKIDSLHYQVADREARFTEVSASLDREREMLSAGREIRDIMGARDLHIVDVVDRDGKGRARKTFGRAFYTQGKSLIFYAFDLPAKNTADGKFVYAAWGSNSNDLKGSAAHSLGIFYNDDQTQHRWAMKFDDPKLLQEIDTVFVTLEPAGKPFGAPTGKPLLEAYFGTPPNHP